MADALHPKIIVAGREFLLDRLIDDPVVSASFPTFQEGYRIDPESSWQEGDQFANFEPPILLQVQNGCTGHMGCSMMYVAWREAGYPAEDFSPTWLYAMANGGIDRGASIVEILKVMIRYGCCLQKTFPERLWSPRSATQAAYDEAVNFKVAEGYTFSTWEEKCTALSRGFVVGDSVQVGNDFMRTDAANHWVVPVDRGPGNHAVMPGRLWRLKGVTYTEELTSWGPDAFNKGRFSTTKQHALSQGSGYSGIVVVSVVRTDDIPIVSPK